MRILVINGANLNMLGIREREVYGDKSHNELKSYVRECAKELGIKVKCVQSNCEGRLVEFIQRAYKRYDGIVINAGAYTHTSVAILDALKAVGITTVEVHLTDTENREDFRKLSYVGMYAKKRVIGKGFEGYKEALAYFANEVKL